MKCPLDGELLRVATQQDDHACQRCGGIWLPRQHVRDTIDLPDVQILRKVTMPATRRIACPTDGSALLAFMHQGVEIDVCPRCKGVWLDAQERDKITPEPRGNRLLEAASDTSSAVDLIDLAGDAAKTILEFVGDAFSSLN